MSSTNYHLQTRVVTDAIREPRYSLRDNATFAEQARNATFDLTTDEGVAAQKRAYNQTTWDKKKKKFVKGDGTGADNVKMVKTESGVKLPATYRSGRFDEWKAKSKFSLPKVGEMEDSRFSGAGAGGKGGKKFRHHTVTEAKPLDKLHKGYERKVRQMKKSTEVSGPSEAEGAGGKGKGKGRSPGGRYGAKSMGRVKNELKSVEQIRRDRKVAEQRKVKNARPSRKKGKR